MAGRQYVISGGADGRHRRGEVEPSQAGGATHPHAGRVQAHLVSAAG